MKNDPSDALDWCYRSDFCDELIGPRGGPRVAARRVWKYLRSLDRHELVERREACEIAALVAGITFRVYHDEGSADRAMPFDLIPRIISLREWERTRAGLEQRVTALNLFIDDLYGDQKIVADGVFPADVLAGAVNFREQCRGVRLRYGVTPGWPSRWAWNWSRGVT